MDKVCTSKLRIKEIWHFMRQVWKRVGGCLEKDAKASREQHVQTLNQ